MGFVFVAGYWSEFQDSNKNHISTAATLVNHNNFVTFIVFNLFLELVSILLNRSLKMKYWEQELIAIKMAFS